MKQISQKVRMNPGLAAFEDVLDYVLTSIPENPFFFWLDADDGPSFILTKPEFFFPEYIVQVKRESLSNIQIGKNEPVVYLIVTVPEKMEDATANLMAPVLLNEEQGIACQIVLHDTPYTTKHYLFPPEKRKNCG
jgi:flagellar assembly factor FliW